MFFRWHQAVLAWLAMAILDKKSPGQTMVW
jgi:hypothetical protein